MEKSYVLFNKSLEIVPPERSEKAHYMLIIDCTKAIRECDNDRVCWYGLEKIIPQDEIVVEKVGKEWEFMDDVYIPLAIRSYYRGYKDGKKGD